VFNQASDDRRCPSLSAVAVIDNTFRIIRASCTRDFRGRIMLALKREQARGKKTPRVVRAKDLRAMTRALKTVRVQVVACRRLGLHIAEGALWCSSHVLDRFLTILCGERELRRDSRSALFVLLFDEKQQI
jgi:hypothetical protein